MNIRVVKVNLLRTPEQRETVCYVGRAFAGWPASPWGNPYKPAKPGELSNALDSFSLHAIKRGYEDPSYLASLWEACEHGAKPLGCWCINAIHGDGQPVVCHAQILAQMLHERFG